MNKIWQASEARTNFSALLDQASKEPQIVRHRSGDEYVVLSRRDYEETKPSLAAFLLAGGLRPEPAMADDVIDTAFDRSTAPDPLLRDVDFGP